ncbi:MAG TPA: aminotransferase class V-fold PLP-dependent enzyme [Candidatus Polarisedimenticolia bacterium]|nr:aminotransferase class V-fold PLP-dependent enzyme [Candidatus Polarisedimenticolia bacterium]
MSTSRRDALRWGLGTLAALPLQGQLLKAAQTAATQPLPDLAGFGDRKDEEFWSAVRRCFALPSEVAYFNNGSLGPTPLPVLRDLAGFAHQLAASPAPQMWGPLGARLEEVRSHAAALLGAAPDDVALTRNTTEGVSTVGMGLSLAAGDEVITTDQEHPGGAGVWQFLETRGIRRIAVPLPMPPETDGAFLGRLEAAITPKTRVLALPHVTFGSGHLLPLDRVATIARRRNLLFCVDGAHPPGMMPLDLRALGCDTYASSSHKWLMAPPGTGLLYVSPAARERIAPRVFTGTGFSGKTARRYDDFGTRNLAEVLAQGSAIEFHNRIGTERAWERIQALSARLRDGLKTIPKVRILTPLEPGRSGGLTAFSMEGIPHKAASDFLADKPQCVVRPVPELDAVRVSTAIYNLPAEIDRLLTAVKQLAVSFRA